MARFHHQILLMKSGGSKCIHVTCTIRKVYHSYMVESPLIMFGEDHISLVIENKTYSLIM